MKSILLLLQPRRDLLHPAGGVFAQPGTAEVDALAVVLAEVALESIAVRAFEGDAPLPQRRWRCADVGRRSLARNMVTTLRHEPRGFPADLSARGADELLQ